MNFVESKNLFDSVDVCIWFVGFNKMEILFFFLGMREIFGINVFKVWEVGRMFYIMKMLNMFCGVEGLIFLCGNVIFVLLLVFFM